MQRVILSFITLGYFFFSSVACGAGTFTSSFGTPTLLPPEQAFVVSQPRGDIIEIAIAEGTYLYDQRTIVQNDDGQTLIAQKHPSMKISYLVRP